MNTYAAGSPKPGLTRRPGAFTPRTAYPPDVLQTAPPGVPGGTGFLPVSTANEQPEWAVDETRPPGS